MLEVCVDSFDSVEAAVKGGAHRIELCSALSEGGLTPSVGFLKTVKAKYPGTTVFALLRPHSRISYQHTDTDMEIIKFDMSLLIDGGADGFVFGALTADRDIDVQKCRFVIENARGLPVTFHPAFNMTIPELMLTTVDKIAECGFARIESSGFAESADAGKENLLRIQNHIKDRGYNLVLMPGCGVTTRNAESILLTTRCKEFHASAKTARVENIRSHPSDTPALTKEIKGNSYSVADQGIVQQLVTIGKMYS